MAGLLSRDAILGSQDRTYQDVSISCWGGKVRVQSLSGSERDAFEESILGAKNKDGSREVITKNLRAKLVSMTAVDGDGKLLFSHEDVTALGAKNGAAIDKLFTVAQKLSGISKDDVEDMVKNSGAVPSADSISPSPES